MTSTPTRVADTLAVTRHAALAAAGWRRKGQSLGLYVSVSGLIASFIGLSDNFLIQSKLNDIRPIAVKFSSIVSISVQLQSTWNLKVALG